jgi:hypothetical protein
MRPVRRAAAVAGLLAIMSCGGGTPSAGGGTPATGSSGGSGWSTVSTFSGEGHSQDTAPFTLHGGTVRFEFTVQPNSTGPVPFLSQMFKQGMPVSANELHRTSCVSCDGRQTDEAGTVRAGTYYLHVITSRPWTLTVEERK